MQHVQMNSAKKRNRGLEVLEQNFLLCRLYQRDSLDDIFEARDLTPDSSKEEILGKLEHLDVRLSTCDRMKSLSKYLVDSTLVYRLRPYTQFSFKFGVAACNRV